MTIHLRIALIALTLIFLFVIVRQIAKGRLQLKYSLLWFALGIALLLCALCPGLVEWCSLVLGIGVPSNFVFLVGIVFLLGICLSLCVIVSKQGKYIRTLTQRLAILEKEFNDKIDSGNGSQTQSEI